MKTLVLATDDSEPAREAASHILKSYSPDTYSIVIVSVASAADIMKQYGRYEGLESVLTEDLENEIAEEARSVAEATADRFISADYDVRVEVPIGHPGEEICQLVESEGADGIVLGRRGRSSFRELLLGSVSNYVLHHVQCPVTIIPNPDQE